MELLEVIKGVQSAQSSLKRANRAFRRGFSFALNRGLKLDRACAYAAPDVLQQNGENARGRVFMSNKLEKERPVAASAVHDVAGAGVHDVVGRIDGTTLRSWELWRNLAVCFCVFSVVGHWIEIPYCLFNDYFFGIVDPETLVYQDPMYPFLVYGIGACVCTLLFVPLKEWLVRRCATPFNAMTIFFGAAVFMCMVMELGMGLLLNQPDAFGEYPLWDNSQLPFNILGQAWLVNDILLGLVASVYSWVVWPFLASVFAKIPDRAMNIGSIVLVVAFTVLCIVKFS